MLQVKLEKLGPIVEGEFQVKKLTVLCGENNTGKTYASYSIYGLLCELRHLLFRKSLIDQLIVEDQGQFDIDLSDSVNSLKDALKLMSEKTSEQLYKIFSAKQETFSDAKISIGVNEQSFLDFIYQTEETISIPIPEMDNQFIKKAGSFIATIIYSTHTNDAKMTIRNLIKGFIHILLMKAFDGAVFLLPAERSGLNLFYRELNATRNELIQGLGVDLLNNIGNEDVRRRLQQTISPYPTPISDYLSFLNRFDAYDDEESPFIDLAQEIQTTILKGSYEIQDQQIIYKNEKGTPFHLHISSSTVKSLFGLVFYLTYIAKPGQYLIIDEPELNLHPDNQRKLAKVLAKIANRGINVILSTHSDYLIKEFNNLIMLSKMSKNRVELMQKYGYEESQLLNPEDVSPVLFVDDRVVPMEIDPVEGIIAETFDNVINRYNEVANEIYYALQE
ncbi:MAG: ATP-binding protein, partial [Tumebacillaceae bacterium]